MDDPNTFDPAAALASVHEARANLSARLDEGGWRYDLTYSALAAMIVAGQALPLGLSAIASATGAIALGVLAREWARRKGVWVCGSTPRRARWAAIGVGLGICVLAMIVFFCSHEGEPWAALPAAGLAMGLALVGSRLWRRLYRLDLQDSSAPPPRPYGVMLAAGLVMAAAAVGAFLMHADAGLIGWLVGCSVAMSGMSALFMWRRAAQARVAR